MTKKLLLPLIIFIHLLLLFKTRFTLWPEMVVYPYLLNNGFRLYTDIINPYLPILPYSLALFSKIFGYDPFAFRVLTSAIITVIDISIFFTAYKITKNFHKASVVVLSFILASIPFGINGLWFDLVQTIPIIFSTYFLYIFLKKDEKKYLLYSGILFAIIFFIKQQAIWLLPWYFLSLLLKSKNISKTLNNSATYLLPSILLFLALTILASSNKIFDDFIFWTIYFPFFESSRLPGYLLLPSTKQIFLILSLIVIFLPTLLALNLKKSFFTLTGIILVLFAYPRFDYFHLIPSLSVLSISIPNNIEYFKKTTKTVKLISLSALIFLLLFLARNYSSSFGSQTRFFENNIYKASETLQGLTSKNDKVYMQNAPDQIFVISKRLPVKPWADEFPWYLELKGQQEKIVNSLSTQKPKIIVFQPLGQSEDSFEIGTYYPEKITAFINENYENYLKINETLYFKKQKQN